MDRISRRTLLKFLSSSIGAYTVAELLSACNPVVTRIASPTPLEPTDTLGGINPTGEVEPLATKEEIPVESTATSSALPDLVVARGGEPQVMVERALAAIGGMERFVPKGGWVIIKPNICNSYHGYEYASTTNPWVVAALVRLCLGAGAKKVQVMDSPFGGTAANAYVSSGIAEQVGLAGGEMIDMPGFKFKEVAVKDPVKLKSCFIYEDVFKADLVINVPIAKTHSLAKLTLGMKNMMGLIQNREYFHSWMGERLTDLNRTIHPALTVVDAIRILTANGPTGGNLDDVKQLDTIIVSTDVVAADSYATGLFGLRPEDVGSIVEASKAGFGVSDLNNLRIEELSVGT
jgi:uncharacterized protein (DUF362 family)